MAGRCGRVVLLLLLLTCPMYFVKSATIVNIKARITERIASRGSEYSDNTSTTSEGRGCTNDSSCERRNKHSHHTNGTTFSSFDEMPPTIGIRSDECSVTIAEESAKDFVHLVNDESANFIWLSLNVTPTPRVKNDTLLFYPYMWMWTYSGEGGSFETVKYPYDINVLSSRTLNIHRRFIGINLLVHPEHCTLIMGDEGTDMLISDALMNATERFKDIRIRTTSYFCYGTIKNVYTESKFIYYVSHFAGNMGSYLFTKCCSLMTQKEDGWNDQRQNGSHCKAVYLRDTWTLHVLFVASFLFAISPTLVLNVLPNETSLQTSRRRKVSYRTLLSVDSGTGQEDTQESTANDTKEWLYLDQCLPIGFGHAVRTLFCYNSTSLSFYRLRRAVLWLISPILIYIQIFIYGEYMYEATRQLAKKDVPLGFKVMNYGFWIGTDNWKYFLGGPSIAFAVYFILGTLLLMLPSNITEFLFSALDLSQRSGVESEAKTPLLLSIKDIGEIANTDFSENTGLKLLCKILRARLFMVVYPSFWKHCFHIWSKRMTQGIFSALNFQLCVRRRGTKSQGWRYILLLLASLPGWFLCFITAVLEISLFLPVHCVPIFYFTAIVCKAYLKHVWHCFGEPPIGVCRKLMRGLCTLFVLLLFPYLFLFLTTLHIHGISFGLEFIVYTFTGLIVYPKETFGYVLMAWVICFYVVNCLTNLSHDYRELQILIINICEKFDTTIEPKLLERLKRIDLRHFIIYDNHNVPGIPRHMFQHVIKEHLPVPKACIKSFVKLVATSYFVYMTISIVVTFNRQEHMDDVMNGLMAIFISALPKLFEHVYSRSTGHVKKVVFERNVEKTILEYMDANTVVI